MRRFNKLTGNIILVFHIILIKEKVTLLSTEKHEPWLRIPLRSVSLEEELAGKVMFTWLKII